MYIADGCGVHEYELHHFVLTPFSPYYCVTMSHFVCLFLFVTNICLTVWYEPTCVSKASRIFSHSGQRLYPSYVSPNLAELRRIFHHITGQPISTDHCAGKLLSITSTINTQCKSIVPLKLMHVVVVSGIVFWSTTVTNFHLELVCLISCLLFVYYCRIFLQI